MNEVHLGVAAGGGEGEADAREVGPAVLLPVLHQVLVGRHLAVEAGDAAFPEAEAATGPGIHHDIFAEPLGQGVRVGQGLPGIREGGLKDVPFGEAQHPVSKGSSCRK